MGWVDPWVGLGRDFSAFGGLGCVSQLMGWVGSGHTKWTRGQLWYRPLYVCSNGPHLALVPNAAMHTRQSNQPQL